MKKLSGLAVVLILVGTAAWAQAAIGTGQWLHDCWVADKQVQVNLESLSAVTLQSGMYRGFVLGVAMMGNEREKMFLIPDDATYAQIDSVVGNYLDAHPELWNSRADTLVIAALRAVWPYRK